MKMLVYSLGFIFASVSAQAALIVTPPPSAPAGDIVHAETRQGATSYNYMGGGHFSQTTRPTQTICYDGNQKVACPKAGATAATSAAKMANPLAQGNGYKPSMPAATSSGSSERNQYAQPDGN